MSFTITYQPLFELHVFHNYFLGNGELAYDDSEVPDVFTPYNVLDFIRIVPKSDTQNILRNHKILIKPTRTGLMGLVSVDDQAIPIIDSSELTLEFYIYITDPLFEKYTDLDISNAQRYQYSIGNGGGNQNLKDLSSAILTYDSDENSSYQELLKDIPSKERMSFLGEVSLEVNKLLQGNAVPDETRKYKIVFNSKKTTWVYIDDKDNEIYRTNKQFPFVKRGTIKVRNQNQIYRMATPRDTVEAGEAKIYV